MTRTKKTRPPRALFFCALADVTYANCQVPLRLKALFFTVNLIKRSAIDKVCLSSPLPTAKAVIDSE